MDSIKIKDLLRGFEDFEIIPNSRPICSSEEGAAYFQIEVGQTAPTLILKGDNEFFAAVISGGRRRLEMKEMARILGVQKVKLASPEEVKELTGHTVGTIPMVGLELPCILDEELFKYDYVYGGTGEADKTLKIAPRVLEIVNKVIAKFL